MATEGTGASCARDLGQGWKVNPSVDVEPGETCTIADIAGPGAIQHLWMTPTGTWRFWILRIYWDDQQTPSVECPIGDFFANGWDRPAQVTSLPVCVNPLRAFNSYWEMPFRKRCRITLTNLAEERAGFTHQIDYTLTDVPADAAYFHAQFRRVNPLPYKEVVTIVDGIRGKGHYVGTYMAWGSNASGWWGEGEIKFYMDGDADSGWPTICGTGTEDYFCGSYGFHGTRPDGKRDYREFTTDYAGMPQVIRPEFEDSQTRFGLYRWHIMDPVRFEKDLKVTMQALGWRKYGKFLPLQDDIASVGFWYQTLPTAPFPTFPSRDDLEII